MTSVGGQGKLPGLPQGQAQVEWKANLWLEETEERRANGADLRILTYILGEDL